MKKQVLKTFICLVLSINLTVSLTACKGKEVSIDDYGKGAATTNESDSSTEESDSITTSEEKGKTFRDVYGKKVDFEESFNVGKTAINPSCHCSIPDEVYPTVYKAKLVDDGKSDEDKLVKTILGENAKKLDEIEYTGAADYVTMIDKYRNIMISHEYAMMDPDSPATESLTEDTDPKEGIYTWKDDTDLYIHMYEGEYNNVRYGLILAYDYQTHQKTIFMDPISINDYFPEGDYKNLIIEESVDTMGNEKNLDNACSYTNDEALDMTKEFLESKLGIGDEMFSFSPNDSTVYQRNYYGGAAYLGVESIMSLSKNNSSNTLLNFTDSSTDGIVLGRTDIKLFIELQYSDKTSNSSNSYVDGYAIFLNPLYSTEMDGAVNSSQIYSNYGMVKVTSKGIYGIDITLTSEITEIVNDVNILEFDKITESLKNNLQEELDVKTINANKLDIHFISLQYFPYFEKDDMTEFIYIPAWSFYMSALNGHGAYVTVNALDGSTADIMYY